MSNTSSLSLFLNKSTNQNTRKAYHNALRDFDAYCQENGYSSLPADVDTVLSYLAYCAEGLKLNTVKLRKSAISWAHVQEDYSDPTFHPKIKKLLHGIRKVEIENGVGIKKAPALPFSTLQELVDQFDSTTRKGSRNRVLFMVGFFGAFRRSELLSINIEHLEFKQKGVIIIVPRSKTDKEGLSKTKAIPYNRRHPSYCPVCELQDYINILDRDHGPLFVSLKNKNDTLSDNRLSFSGWDKILKESLGPSYSTHSLRAGFVTHGLKAGLAFEDLMNQTWHQSTQMLKEYERYGDRFDNNHLDKMY